MSMMVQMRSYLHARLPRVQQQLDAWIGDNRRSVGLFLLYNVLFHIGMLGIVDVLLNFYFVSLGYDLETISLLQSLPRITGFLTSIPIGLLAHRLGERRVLMIASLGLGVSMAAPVFAPTLTMMWISRLCLGFFYGAQQIVVFPYMNGLIARSVQTRFFALHNVVSMAAMAAGSVIGGLIPGVVVQVLQVEVGPQSTFAYGAGLVIASLLTALSGLPLLLVQRQSPAVAPPVSSPVPPDRVPVRWTGLIWLNLPMLTFGFTGGLTFPFYNLFFRSRYGLTDDAVGTIMSLGWLGMAVLPLANPWLERQFGRVRALVLSLGIAAVAFVALAYAGTVTPGIIAFMLAISFRNVMLPFFQPMILEDLPASQHNLVTSFSNLMWNIGWFSATAISGYLQQTFGFTVILNVTAVGLVLTGVMLPVIFRPAAAVLVEGEPEPQTV